MRVDGDTPKPSGAILANKGEQSREKQSSKLGKRAYRRAVRRAEAEGSTFYKGRILYSNGQHARVPGKVNPPQSDRRRGVFCWNAGGISSELYAELLRYLETKEDISFVIVQETHWSTTGEWTAGK